MTTVRLNSNLENKISALVALEHVSKSEIIKKAILEYYDHHLQTSSPYELGKGLFGKYGAEDDLSSTYKKRLLEQLSEKYTH